MDYCGLVPPMVGYMPMKFPLYGWLNRRPTSLDFRLALGVFDLQDPRNPEFPWEKQRKTHRAVGFLITPLKHASNAGGPKAGILRLFWLLRLTRMARMLRSMPELLGWFWSRPGGNIIEASWKHNSTLWLCQNSYWKWAIYSGFSH